MLLGQGKRAGDARKQASKQASRRAALSRLGSSKTSFHDEQGFFLYLKIALDFFVFLGTVGIRVVSSRGLDMLLRFRYMLYG